jgi:hypothetical protein
MESHAGQHHLINEIHKALVRLGYLDHDQAMGTNPGLSAVFLEALEKAHIAFREPWRLGRLPQSSKTLDPEIARRLRDFLERLNQPRCGTPDLASSQIDFKTFGSPGGRWSKGVLVYNVSSAGSAMEHNDVRAAIRSAFDEWQNACPYFSFIEFMKESTETKIDIEISFGGTQVDSRFGAVGGVAAGATYPEDGRLFFDRAEQWDVNSVYDVALHEIGHILGLGHSTDNNSIMYPSGGPDHIDAETNEAINSLYGGAAMGILPGVITKDRPAMAAPDQPSNDEGVMVWRAGGDNQSIWSSRLQNGFWQPIKKIPGMGTTHSPCLTYDGGAHTYVMAWKGVEDDQHIFYSKSSDFSAWDAQKSVPGVGTSNRPSLTVLGPTVFLAWKGVDGDPGIYWSQEQADGWAQQQVVFGATTEYEPCLVAFNGRLYLFYRGEGDDQAIYYNWRGGQPSDIWQGAQRVTYPEATAQGIVFHGVGTHRAPSACVRGNRILLAWRGVDGDAGIYFSYFDGETFTGQIRLNAVSTDVGPTVADAGSHSLMCFKGPAGLLYWTQL